MAKKKYDFKEGQIIVVDWLDAHSVDAWTGKDELEAKIVPQTVRTVGFYKKTTHHAVVLVSSMGTTGEDDDVAGVWVIPKGMVQRIEVVRG